MANKRNTHIYKNNLVGAAKGGSVEGLTSTWTRFDFGIHWFGADGAGGGGGATVHLWPSLVVPNPALLIEPTGNAVLTIKWLAGTNPGTIKEQYSSWVGSTETVVLTRDNVDPGYGGFRIQDTDPPDVGRPGPRYTFLLSGTEYRVYVNYLPGLGQKPIVIVPAPSTGMPFPLYLYMIASANVAIRAVTAGGTIRPSTIYSAREQVKDFGSVQAGLHIEVQEAAKYAAIGDGFPVDGDF